MITLPAESVMIGSDSTDYIQYSVAYCKTGVLPVREQPTITITGSKNFCSISTVFITHLASNCMQKWKPKVINYNLQN